MRQLLSFVAIVILAAGALWYSLSPQYKPLLGLDLRGGMRVTLAPDKSKPDGTNVRPDQMEKVRDVLEARVNSFGLSGSDVRLKTTGANQQILVVLPGVKNPEEALKVISKVAQLEFRYLSNVRSDRNFNAPYSMHVTSGDATEGKPDSYAFTDERTKKPVPEEEVIEKAELILRGNTLKPVSKAEIDTRNGQPIVAFEFNAEGAKSFGDFTSAHVGEILAVVLDNKIVSAPRIDSAITEGHGTISGGFKTMAEARLLANLLNSGSLPIPLQVEETQTVGATLGQASIDRSIQAGLLGLGLVLVFMLAYYWLPGALACIALIIYAAITFSIFKGFPFLQIPPIVLDLPGITGFILSVGMAVDANVLIFERLKEEMRSGKSLHAAIDAGFKRAFTSILDSNVTTWIVCTILIWLGVPVVKGFAITLAIGVAVSMFTAITVTQTILHLVLEMPWARNPALYGLNVSWSHLFFPSLRQGGILHVFAKRKINFGISLALAAVALVFILLSFVGMGLKPGIDFTGGSAIEMAFRNQVSTDDVKKVLETNGVHDAVVSTAKLRQQRSTFTITARDVDAATQTAVKDRLSSIHAFDAAGYHAEYDGKPVDSPAAGDAKTDAAKPADDKVKASTDAKPADTTESDPTKTEDAAKKPTDAKPADAAKPGEAAKTDDKKPADAAKPGDKPADKNKPADAKGKTFVVTSVYNGDIPESDILTALTKKADDKTSLDLKGLEVKRNFEDLGERDMILVQSAKLGPEQTATLKTELNKLGGGVIESMYQVSSIGSSVAREITLNAFFSVLVASLAIILYLAFRFAIGGFMNGLKFGTCAVVALMHDVGIVVGIFALLGFVAHWQVDALFVTATLTILGFSVHDTIVVYDRIRENLVHRQRGETFADVSDRSITQTFDRSVNTSLTVLLVVAALVIFGGASVRQFNIALLIGIAIGTYSSIFVASPLVVLWEQHAAAGQALQVATPQANRPVPPRPVAPRRETAGVTPRPSAPRPPAAPRAEVADADGDADVETDDRGDAGRPRPGGVRPKRKRRL